jgi:hypothetical protein
MAAIDPITAALLLLHGDDRPARERIVAATRPAQTTSSGQPNGWVVPNDPHIYISTESKMYKKAADGDADALKEMAGNIGHEAYHQSVTGSQPGDAATKTAREGAAYQKQLELLRSLGASKGALSRVLQSQQWNAPGYKPLPARGFAQQLLQLQTPADE